MPAFLCGWHADPVPTSAPHDSRPALYPDSMKAAHDEHHIGGRDVRPEPTRRTTRDMGGSEMHDDLRWE